MHAQKFVDSYLEAWNQADAKAVARHLARDGVYLDVPENAHRNRDELIGNLADFFRKSQHHYELIGDILANDNTIAFQYRMIPRDGKGEPIRGAEFITLHGDSAVSIRDYYDVPDAARPAGAAATVSRQAQPVKYAKSGLSESQIARYKARLDEMMGEQEAYLQPDLTLPSLAKAAGCSVNHLSQVINAGFGMSFFDWVSQFRIERAKELLADEASRDEPVLTIAFAVGFNSNSAFYSAFRKWVGQTPTQYRKAQFD